MILQIIHATAGNGWSGLWSIASLGVLWKAKRKKKERKRKGYAAYYIMVQAYFKKVEAETLVQFIARVCCKDNIYA